MTEVIALILALLGNRPDVDRIKDLAPVFIEKAERHGLEPTLCIAVCFKESSCRERPPIGAAGEIGIMHVKPGGMERYLCRGLKWRRSVEDNIDCGVRILARSKQRCGGRPLRWLGGYKGWKKCGPRLYARRVLRILRMGKAVTR